MTFNDLVKDCIMPVEFYATELYDWEKHNFEEKQSKSDVNKAGSTLKIFKDEQNNVVHIYKSKSIEKLPDNFKYQYTSNTLEMFEIIIKKEFYFCCVIRNGSDTMEFPNEIWLSLEDASQGCIKYL